MGVVAAAQSALGLIPKAMICAPSAEFMEIYARAASLPSAPGVPSPTVALDKAMMKNADLVEKQMYLASKGGREAEKIINDALKAFNYVAMEVQYNPSSLYFTSSEGYSYSINDGGFGGQPRQVETTKAPTSVTMSCELIFDAMSRHDAFGMSELADVTGNLSVSNGVSLGQDIWVQVHGGYSVEDHVNALLACMFSSMTRQVIFYWAGMSFRGELTSISANYNMFNKDGNPIRAHVKIEIYQKNDGTFNYDQMQFETAFRSVFRGKVTAAGNVMTQGNSILNPIL